MNRFTARARRHSLVAAVVFTATIPLTMGAAVASGGGESTVIATPDQAACPWMNTTLTADQRAHLLLDASSQYQKYRWLVEQPANSPQQTTFSGVTYPVQLPCTPTVVYSDGPDGVRFTAGVTAFPAPIAQAATWDTALAQQKAADQAAEAFAKGKNVLLAPGIASGRTPLSGRTPEYLGEDSLLSGTLAAAAVNGFQNGDPSTPVLASVKHFVANEQETDRQTSSSNMDARTLHEVYGQPLDIALAHSNPWSVMCSYNQINGAYACENGAVLNGLLKGTYGFKGYVVSDFGAVHSTAPSLVNGLDQELNRPVYYTPAKLDAALGAGQITQAQIDAAAFRVVRAYIAGGLFDHPMPTTVVADASTAAHKATALQTAEESSVLLKNDGVLPLAAGAGTTIALIGPTVSSTPTNGISAASVCSEAWRFNNAGTMNCEALVSPETAITARAAQVGAHVVVNNGADLASAAATAASADLAVVFGYQRTGEFADLANLNLQGNGDALVSSVAAANPKTVVVLQTGSAVVMPWLSSVKGVLETWYAGEQMGPALANVLFGDVAPSGKLPMTFPKSLADTPTAGSPSQYPGTFSGGSTTRPAGSTEIRQVSYSEGLAVGYKWYQSQGIDPLFPFGYGLTYTPFAYDKLTVTPLSTDGTHELRIRTRVANTGQRAGTETVQAYVTLPSSTGEPGSRLVGWQKVTLQPGEQRWVEITLSAADLANEHLLQHWDPTTGAWATASGTYGVAVGGSSEGAMSTTFTVRPQH